MSAFRPVKAAGGTRGRRRRLILKLTLEYERAGEWYVGQLLEVPGAVSQARTLSELEAMILDALAELMAYRMSEQARVRRRRRPRSAVARR